MIPTDNFPVSRTCTAPFDRLKIFLITRPPEMGGTSVGPKPSVGGLKSIGGAVARIYAEGGILAFWTGNGLSVMKIFPESAIKFMTYETAVRPLHTPVSSVRYSAFGNRNVRLPDTGITSKIPEI